MAKRAKKVDRRLTRKRAFSVTELDEIHQELLDVAADFQAVVAEVRKSTETVDVDGAAMPDEAKRLFSLFIGKVRLGLARAKSAGGH